MSSILFILFASDPEMSAIEGLLTECQVPYVCAVDAKGNRCHTGNAYSREVQLATGALISARPDYEVLTEGGSHGRPTIYVVEGAAPIVAGGDLPEERLGVVHIGVHSSA